MFFLNFFYFVVVFDNLLCERGSRQQQAADHVLFWEREHTRTEMQTVRETAGQGEDSRKRVVGGVLSVHAD